MPAKNEKHETKNKKHELNSKKYQTTNPQRKILDEYDQILAYYAHSKRLSPTTFYLSFSLRFSI